MTLPHSLRHILANTLGALLMAAAACAAPAFTMKLSTTSTNDSLNEWLKTFKAGIEARAGDRIKVEYYPSGQLGPAPRVIEGVVMGTVEVAMNSIGFYEGLNARFGTLSAVGLFDSIELGNKVLNDPQVRAMFATYGKDQGYEILAVHMAAPLVVVTKTPYLKREDIEGKKIRVPGSPLYLNILRELGAAPVSMTQGEVVPALQNGAISGALGASVIFPPLKFYDVAKSMTYLPSTYIGGVGIVSSQFMQAIGPELAAIVREEAYKADQHIYTWFDDLERGRKTWEENGGKSYELEPAEAQRYLGIAAKASQEMFNKHPQAKQDYELLKSVAAK